MPAFSNSDHTSMLSNCSSHHGQLEAEDDQTSSNHTHDVDLDEDQISEYMSGRIYMGCLTKLKNTIILITKHS